MDSTILTKWLQSAPPIPNEILEARLESIKINEPDYCQNPWNDFVLARIAILQARWAMAYAKAVQAEFERATK